MSTEIDSMILGLAQFHDVWPAFVEIAVGTWLLSTIVGKICYLIIPIAIGKLTGSCSLFKIPIY